MEKYSEFVKQILNLKNDLIEEIKCIFETKSVYTIYTTKEDLRVTIDNTTASVMSINKTGNLSLETENLGHFSAELDELDIYSLLNILKTLEYLEMRGLLDKK